MQWVSVDDISGIGPPTFGTIGKITDAILLSPSVPESYDYDTISIACLREFVNFYHKVEKCFWE